ncbi:MAG: hypothetical protein OHK0013_26950 [Sandaracinaceae bacterium]
MKAMLVGPGLLVGPLALAAGCDCGSPPLPPMVDAARPRVDAGAVDAYFETADIGPLVDAPPGPREDTGPVDAFVPMGFDGGMGSALDCLHMHALGEDVFLLSRDGNKDVPSFTSVVGSDGQLVSVYSSSDFVPGSGLRNLEVFRVIATGPDRGPVPPAIIPGTEGASLPTLAAGPGGFWLSYVQGGNIRVARFDTSFAPVGSPATVASASPTTPPRLARTSTGGFLIWVSGSEIRGRALDANAAPMGPERTLVSGGPPIQQASIERVGSGDALAVAWADGGIPRVARLDPSAGTLGTASNVAGDPGIFTSIDMGGFSPGSSMVAPLNGATVYDLNDMGFRDVVFRIVSDTALPALPVATVAMGGDQAWGATVEPFLSGYAIAYRARIPGIALPVLRVGYLDREGCRVGAVSDRFVIGTIGSETGAPPQLGVQGGTMMIVWSEEQDTYYEYWAATLTCGERS